MTLRVTHNTAAEAVDVERRRRGLSVHGAARITGIHRMTWHRWANGSVQPTLANLQVIADRFDTPIVITPNREKNQL